MLTIISDKMPRLQKNVWVHHKLFNVTSRCVKWYRVVVSEKFYKYEYTSTVLGPSLSTGINASLISRDQIINKKCTRVICCSWKKHNQKLQQFKRC